MKTKPLIVAGAVLLTACALAGGTGREARAQAAGPEVPGLRYEIRVELDDVNKTLAGTEDIAWFNRTSEPVSDMLFHLYWNAFKNEQSVFFKEMTGGSLFSRGGLPKEGEWGWIDVTEVRTDKGLDLTSGLEFVHPDGPETAGDETALRVRLPEPVQPGGYVRLSLSFRSKIPRTVARSGYYRDSFFIAQWFPKPGVYEEGRGWNAHAYHLNSEFFADFADFIVHITLPEKYVVGATGKEVEVKPAGKPGLVTRTYVQSMVHDFAWTADRRYVKLERRFSGEEDVSPEEYREAAETLSLEPGEVRLPDVRMILLIAPEHKRQADRHFRALANAIKYYGLWYGPYPYETITLVDPPFRTESGGMEYPTFVTGGTRVLTPKDYLSTESVIVHEFGHNYWYGLCANNEFEEAWLDEGINTYSTARAMDRAYGPGRLPAYFAGLPLGPVIPTPKIGEFETYRAAALFAVRLDPVVTASWKFSEPMSYGANVYMRAATLLRTLEGLLGEPVMAKVMRTFQTRFRFRHPTTADFIATVNEVSGRNLNWFFEELFFATRDFDYGVASVRSAEKPARWRGVFDIDGRKEEVTAAKIKELEEAEKKDTSTAAQAGAAVSGEGAKEYVTVVTLRRYGEARLGGDAKVELVVRFEDGSEETRSWDGRDRWARFVIVKPARFKEALIDPGNIWKIDMNLANNSYRAGSVGRNVFRLMARVVFSLQNLFLLASFGL